MTATNLRGTITLKLRIPSPPGPHKLLARCRGT